MQNASILEEYHLSSVIWVSSQPFVIVEILSEWQNKIQSISLKQTVQQNRGVTVQKLKVKKILV